MTSPAQRHMMRVSAAMTAQREAAPLRHATVYEQMLVKLAADQRTLKAIYSKELKAAKKRELLPFWLPWVNGVLEQGKGAQDDILMTVMLWRLDTGDIAGANFQEYVPFPISQDAGERTADLICNPGKKKVSSERIGEVAASRRTNRKTIRADIIKQTDSENQEKYNNCFCIIFPGKKGK